MRKLFLWAAIFISGVAYGKQQAVDSLKYGSFGKIYIYRPATAPDALVLFVSGDGGWNQLPANLSRQLAAQNAMVAGINISHYLTSKMAEHQKCYYPAGDFEELSLYLQKKYKFRNYYKPILMGYSSRRHCHGILPRYSNRGAALHYRFAQAIPYKTRRTYLDT